MADFNDVLQMRFDEVSGDHGRASVDVRPELLQPYGIVHGGVLCAIVEQLGSVTGSLWWGDRGHVVGVSNHTDFIRASREGTLTAEALPVHRGRTGQLWTITITDQTDRLIAKGELRLQNLEDAGRIGH